MSMEWNEQTTRSTTDSDPAPAREGSLVLVRHGESTANADGIFTGVLDVPLTAIGATEADYAADLIRGAGYRFDRMVASTMRRATDTAQAIGSRTGFTGEIEQDWRLDERNYGALTGRTKTSVRLEVGTEQFLRWRRSFTSAPPPMSARQRAEVVASGRAGRPIPPGLGDTESLQDVVSRVGSLWQDQIVPAMTSGASICVVAHGNSLRALCTVLDGLTELEVEALNIPTAEPLVYRFSSAGGFAHQGGRYLDARRAMTAAARIASEGGT